MSPRGRWWLFATRNVAFLADPINLARPD